MPKNIVLCCDGTANDATGDITNVLRVYVTLQRNDDQLCFYDGGVGTLVDPMSLTRLRKWLRRKIDFGIGHSLRDNFCKAYRFLVRNYQPDDRVFLFGFSRGAYTVRALAGAIHALGLLRPELDSLTEYVWAAYANDMDELDDHHRFEAFARFRDYFSIGQTIRIHFVGVFDTVSSVGWIWDYRTLPHTANNPDIAHIRHAVAIDERRSSFHANLVRPANPKQHDTFHEVWFPGVHADIGGGYPEEESGLAKIPLEWMLHEADAQGLQLDRNRAADLLGKGEGEGKSHGHSKPNALADIHQSLTGLYHLLECLPRRTWTANPPGTKPAGKLRWRLPGFWRPRVRPAKPCVHQSALDRKAGTMGEYCPGLLDVKGMTVQPWTVWP